MGLKLCILLCLFVEIKSNVKIFGTGYKDTVPDQYIVAINTQKLKNDLTTYKETKEATAKEFKDYIAEHVPNRDDLQMKSLIFPNYVVLQVTLEPQHLHLLQEHPLVSFIETKPQSQCVQQHA